MLLIMLVGIILIQGCDKEESAVSVFGTASDRKEMETKVAKETEEILQRIKTEQQLYQEKLNEIKQQTPIVGYDGIPFGITFSQIFPYLEKVKGINQVNGKVDFRKSLLSDYYLYYKQREDCWEHSEVKVYFCGSQKILWKFRECFGGNISWNNEEYKIHFNEEIKKLSLIWGTPYYIKEDFFGYRYKAFWNKKNTCASLELELPTNEFALPIVTLDVEWTETKKK